MAQPPARFFFRSHILSALLILAVAGIDNRAFAGAGATACGSGRARVLDSVSSAVEGAESSHGADPRMWRPELEGPQGPMQVSAAAAADVGGGDRFDETQNRALGRAYLAHMFRRYGSWPDAVAAYNWGPGHVNGWISGGRPIGKLPAAVVRYQARVLLQSGLSADALGAALYLPINRRLERLERLRLQARREFAERLRLRPGPGEVERLYAELMQATR
ncbi:MAG TPA: lytic transglycosylase domain-containing protein [Stellaceae bacterium]|nr:lytic transglycosylase domain-containing protein [Stellaceae bacterium]